ncbi:MAG: zinc-ribbon domain-containing protein [Stomatobaculum sp.]|nr:zinc-ribbon domain-containing protein [Stomatobaculum sp.]
MFCENCGQELKDNAKFCENCGTKVPQMRPESEVQAEQAQQENVYAQGAVQTEAPQENWQSQEAPQDTAAEPQQGWQDQNAARPQQGWQDQGAPQPQQGAPQGGFSGMPQGSSDFKDQFMTILGLGNPMSGMSIAALVLTLLCCGIVGVILAVVDIVNDKDHQQNHLLSVIAIAIAVIGMLAGFSGGAATVINNSMSF